MSYSPFPAFGQSISAVDIRDAGVNAGHAWGYDALSWYNDVIYDDIGNVYLIGTPISYDFFRGKYAGPPPTGGGGGTGGGGCTSVCGCGA